MRTSGNLWLIVESYEASNQSQSRCVNLAHIAFLSARHKDEGCEITFADGSTMRVLENYEDLIERMTNPLEEGRIEIAFAADIEDAKE